MKLSALKTKPSTNTTDGVWVDDLPDLPGLRLKVRAFNTPDDRRIQSEAMEKLPRSKRMRGRLDQADQDAVMTERLIGAVLVDWDGLTDDADQPIAFSPDQARVILADPDMSLFRDAVMWAATLVGAENDEARKADAKN